MIKTLINTNGRGEKVIIRRQLGSGNPRDNEGAAFDIQFKNLSGEVKHCFLTYKEVKTLAQELGAALHEADAEYKEELAGNEEEYHQSYDDYIYERNTDELLLKDTRTVSELTTDIMKGFMGC